MRSCAENSGPASGLPRGAESLEGFSDSASQEGIERAAMTVFSKKQLQQPIESVDDLLAYLRDGARPPDKWGVGAEVEKLVLEGQTGEAASYARIEALLERMARSGQWQILREEGRLIALKGRYSSVTLEPGGQLELSGAFCPNLYGCQWDFCRHVSNIIREGEPLGLLFLGLGVQPFTPLKSIDWLPKPRYGIMRTYMLKTGDMGQNMMKQSAGLQVNLDFSDEEDCIDKLRLGQQISPLFYALFANSPLMNGRPTGFLSTRGEIWSRTDPDRTGLIPGLFHDGAGLDTYVDYALDVPMYFIVREKRLFDMTGERFTFRRFLAEGFSGCRAIMADWDLHLSTLFTEVRLRPQIELRSADSLPPGLTLSVAALAKGLLYDADARHAVRSLFRSLSQEDLLTVYRQSWRLGLKTPVGRHTLRELAMEALTIARKGLASQQKASGGDYDETLFLDGIADIAESGVTLAERLLASWHGSRADKLAVLRKHCGFTSQ
jgi:glutamate--cysteine ligase